MSQPGENWPDPIQAKLDKVSQRIKADRAAGKPEPKWQEPSKPAIDTEADKALKQRQWDQILKYLPDAAHSMRLMRQAGIKFELKCLRTPEYREGPDVPDFNAIKISIDVQQAMAATKPPRR